MKQYYYRMSVCPADKDGDAECICWHSIGTGPYPGATPDNAPVLGLSGLPLQLTWRDVPDEVKSDKPKEFKREIRYEVYKRKAIDSMPPAARKKARELLADLNALLDGYGVRARKCVVVEEDWPEYETVWKMIEDRVAGKTAPAQDEREAPEEVEVVAHFQIPTGGTYAGERFTRDGPVPEATSANRTYEPLMTVAQHERIVAALNRPAQTAPQPEQGGRLHSLLERVDKYLAAKGVSSEAMLRRDVRAALSTQDQKNV